jgi:hypothetical protein
MTINSPHNITLDQFTTVFVPAGLMLAWALLWPEIGGDLEVGRTHLTMWPVILLLIPALGLYLFRNTGQTVTNLSHLFWTAALVVFLIHIYWGAFIFYDGLADTFHNQGTLLASANFTLLGIWVLDTVVLWLMPDQRRVSNLHTGVRILVFLLLGLDLIVGRTGAAHLLGFAYVSVLAVAGLARFGITYIRVTA